MTQDFLSQYPCGLYRTTAPLPDHEDQVPAERLIQFHNHSEQGPPLVLLPRVNQHNRWTFRPKGFLISDLGFIKTLKHLPAEGLYSLHKHVHIGTANVLPDNSLVQLGYNRKGDGILFVAEFLGRTIQFADSGYRIPDELFDILVEVNFKVPIPQDPHALH